MSPCGKIIKTVIVLTIAIVIVLSRAGNQGKAEVRDKHSEGPMESVHLDMEGQQIFPIGKSLLEKDRNF